MSVGIVQNSFDFMFTDVIPVANCCYLEQEMDSESIPASGSVDKNRVLTIKPLRYLVPMFPPSSGSSSFSSPQSAPFVCAPPTGPFPPGLSPFYPHQIPYGVDNTIQSPAPLNAIRNPTPISRSANGHASKGSRRKSMTRVTVSEEDGYSDSHDQTDLGNSSRKRKVGRPRGSKKKTGSSRLVKKPSPEVDIETLANNFLSSFNLSGFTSTRRDEGDRDCVSYVLTIYDLLRRKIPQHDDTKDVSRRPDLKAGATLMTKGIRTNAKKRVGSVPGVEIGDIFFFRMELCVVGLHSPSMAGIDYLNLKASPDEDIVAVSIVSSGGYEDNDEDGDVLIYSSQGGNINKNDKDSSDQKLERGNIALENSLHKGNEVRVIRGLKDLVNPTGKVYVYDGLYTIKESWIDKGKLGHNVSKYKLVRIKNQPEAFKLWKSIQLWNDNISARNGVILPDLTSGAENFPVSLFNNVDNEKGPAYFMYFPSLKYGKPFSSSQPSQSCNCRGGCQPGDDNCHCFQKNERNLPYSSLGVVLSINSMIYECGPSCLCPLNCHNRISQAGLKLRLEVFRTNDRGWGLRSWDPIRAGAFICEYAGEVVDESESSIIDQDDYLFDANRFYEPPEFMRGIPNGCSKIPFPLLISSKNVGNVARFMNHGCDPNVYWQPVLREKGNECYLHVAFFAIGHVPPLKELTFNYGSAPSGKDELMKKKCLCGSSKCRGYYY
ncbi:histone-lysine N-methyltransferase, H3 lysine-9 specific SUVH1-like [Impatiens glandulifera]|uniref:histone-lysine N-methyltransferase, H3 lysine-9 specific SUVH1-like n=1 Tax=Impatiens glandulifera TaxID=253017 RepID=UPI001FB14EC0|nr:histone-lysine N-methyltransferase, H3 lysine-9 specific SUVH1-like [Impatiens glandulifera]